MSKAQETYLIYVTKIGYDSKNQGMYEFVFTDDLAGVNEGENWDERPAMGAPQPPDEESFSELAILKTDLIDLDMIKDSEVFSYMDALQGIVAIAYENHETYVEFNQDQYDKLFFFYGETKKSVMAKLYARDLILKFD